MLREGVVRVRVRISMGTVSILADFSFLTLVN